MAKQYGRAIIGKVLEMKEQGYTHREIAELLGYQYKQIKKLVERHNRSQRKQPAIPKRKGRPRIQPLTGQEVLERRIKELEREVDLYRSFSLMCNFFEVSRSGYYAYSKRQKGPGHDEALVNAIQQCQQETNGTYGYRRVGIWLERHGIKANHKAVLRIMLKYGLLAQIRRRRKYRIMGEHLHRYANVLNRDFTATRPNQKWVTDISYIPTGQGVLYLSMIRDLCYNSIVSHKTGTEQTINLVLNTIREAQHKERTSGELQLHSDQGFQYTSPAYFTITKMLGITPSMSRQGNCYDNAMAENFFSIIKSECLNRYKLKTFEQARLLIDNYIHFYNYERVQLETKLTPLEKRRQLV